VAAAHPRLAPAGAPRRGEVAREQRRHGGARGRIAAPGRREVLEEVDGAAPAGARRACQSRVKVRVALPVQPRRFARWSARCVLNQGMQQSPGGRQAAANADAQQPERRTAGSVRGG